MSKSSYTKCLNELAARLDKLEDSVDELTELADETERSTEELAHRLMDNQKSLEILSKGTAMQSAVHYKTAQSYQSMAVQLGNKSYLDKSLQHYDESLKTDPNNPFIISQRAKLLYTIGNFEAVKADIKLVQKLIKNSELSTEGISAEYTIEELLEKLSSQDITTELSGSNSEESFSH